MSKKSAVPCPDLVLRRYGLGQEAAGYFCVTKDGVSLSLSVGDGCNDSLLSPVLDGHDLDGFSDLGLVVTRMISVEMAPLFRLIADELESIGRTHGPTA